MTTTFKHLMIVEDHQSVENSLHPTEQDRALRLIALVEGDEIGESLSDALEEALDGDEPPSDPADYADTVVSVLVDNDFDVYFDDLEVPTTPSTTEVSTT